MSRNKRITYFNNYTNCANVAYGLLPYNMESATLIIESNSK